MSAITYTVASVLLRSFCASGDNTSTLQDSFSTVEDSIKTAQVNSVSVGIVSILQGDSISTVEYCGVLKPGHWRISITTEG